MQDLPSTGRGLDETIGGPRPGRCLDGSRPPEQAPLFDSRAPSVNATRAARDRSWLAWAVGGASLLLLVGASIHSAIIFSDDRALEFVSGIYTSLSMDLSHGVFYRPLASSYGFGGVRYFPLFFALQSSLTGTGLSPLAAGHLISLLSAALAGLAVFCLLRRLGIPRMFAWACGTLVLASAGAVNVYTNIKPDLLAAALGLLGLSFAADPSRARNDPKRIAIATAFFASAVCTKPTSVFGLATAAVYWWLCGRRRAAIVILGATGAAVAIAIGAFDLASNGRFLQIMAACATGGAGQSFLELASSQFVASLLRDPVTAALLVLSLGLVAYRRLRCQPQLPFLLLGITLVGTLVVHGSPGVGVNHLVDLYIACLIFMCTQWQAGSRRAIAVLFVAVALLGSAYVTARSRRFSELVHARGTVERVFREPGRRGRPVFSADPMIPVLAGESSYVLDPMMLGVLL